MDPQYKARQDSPGLLSSFGAELRLLRDATIIALGISTVSANLAASIALADGKQLIVRSDSPGNEKQKNELSPELLEAKKLVDSSDGRLGLPKKDTGKRYPGHPRQHIPRAGQDPTDLVDDRKKKSVTTVFASEQDGLKAIAFLLQADSARIANLKPGKTLELNEMLPNPTRGYVSYSGKAPKEIEVCCVTCIIQRLDESCGNDQGKLHIVTCYPTQKPKAENRPK